MSYALEQSYTYISIDDYLLGERDVEFKSEYIDGSIYAMANTSEQHNTIVHTFGTAIDNALGDECRIWQSDMKVIGHNKNKDFAYYPDIMVACSENTGDQYSRTDPLLIIEVLSPSTERTDLHEKLTNYTSIESLLEYIIVSQSTPYVRLFRRRNNWEVEAYYADDTLTLESIGLKIKVEQIYRRVRKEVGLDIPNAVSWSDVGCG
ncbi:MAG TPA: Uma2 family endonuclease [Leucothrix mucor]|uniref:Uma2 family endonuclease n=1 Tax=Leucothrix mucor TaxID=45248 RepID=A0A7V2SY11_LEUMU|nr:Uma2 family endonuclease [Leucothrix mucor]